MDNTVTTPPGLNGNCSPASSDPACTVRVPVKSYTAVKTASVTHAREGSNVRYTIVITNTGQVAYATAGPASFTDDLTKVLDDATYNNDATGGATYAAPTLSWSGALPIAATTMITYTVTIKTPDTGDRQLHNAVLTPVGSGGSCPNGTSSPTCQSNISVDQAAAAAGLSFTGNDTKMQLIAVVLLLGSGLTLLLAARRRRA
jgi:uncharacterized repeat protein (TIGR01451 family)